MALVGDEGNGGVADDGFFGMSGVDVDGGWWLIIVYWYRGLSGQYNY